MLSTVKYPFDYYLNENENIKSWIVCQTHLHTEHIYCDSFVSSKDYYKTRLDIQYTPHDLYNLKEIKLINTQSFLTSSEINKR
jgi:hypothetical protein